MDKNFTSVIKSFKKKRVLVVGDLILDKNIYGDVSRISPEAPIPILKVNEEKFYLGGAANLANNLSSLGAKVSIIGVLGDDDGRRIILQEFNKNKIDFSSILTFKDRMTTQKIRGFSAQYVFRYDYEKDSWLNKKQEDSLLAHFEQIIEKMDFVLLSDYNKGVLTERIVKSIILLCKKKNKPVYCDCKPNNFIFYKGVCLIKPNKKELIEMTGEKNIFQSIKKLSSVLNSKVVVTLGKEGCLIYDKINNPKKVPVFEKELYDVTGAGDTFFAALSLSLSCNLSLEESSKLANDAASIVVGRLGVSTIKNKELIELYESNIKRVEKEWGEEQWIVNNKKYCGKKLIVKKGHFCSYHFHKKKKETFYVLKGELDLVLKGKQFKLKEGDKITIKPKEAHSFMGIKDSILIEFSTTHFDNDSYRLSKSGNGSVKKWKEGIQKLKT